MAEINKQNADYLVLRAEWFTQVGSRPLIGRITIFDGDLVKVYVGTGHGKNRADDIREIVQGGAKAFECDAEQWRRMGGCWPFKK